MQSEFSKLTQFYIKEEGFSEILNKFPDDLKSVFQEFQLAIDKQNLKSFCEFYELNHQRMGLAAVNINKKAQKNFYHAHLFFVKSHILAANNLIEILGQCLALKLIKIGIIIWPLPESQVTFENIKIYSEIFETSKKEIDKKSVNIFEKAIHLAQEAQNDLVADQEIKKIIKALKETV